MKPFDYASPSTIQEATALLEQHGDDARVLAGGTDIIVQLREGLRDAEIVIDVKKIPELTALDLCNEGGLTLGASTPCCDVYETPDVAAAYPALADSAHIVGGWQIQSRASVGGNLCNSSPAADTIPSLIAHNAICIIEGPTGTREVAAQDFCTAPGRNVLESGELLVTLRLPAVSDSESSAYERFIPRNEMDIAVAGAASWIKLGDDGNIADARIALSAVAATPQFAQEASEYLVGKAPTEENFTQAGELAKNVASPIDDMRGTVEYRVNLVGVLVKRTLATALARIQGDG